MAMGSLQFASVPEEAFQKQRGSMTKSLKMKQPGNEVKIKAVSKTKFAKERECFRALEVTAERITEKVRGGKC